MTGPEPLPDASHMELVLARFAWHLGQTLVSIMHHTVAYAAILDTFYLLLDIRFPHQHRRYYVPVLHLNYLTDSQDPFTHLLLLYLDLATDIHFHKLQRVINWDLNLE